MNKPIDLKSLDGASVTVPRKPDWRRQAAIFVIGAVLAAIACYIIRGEQAVFDGVHEAGSQLGGVFLQLFCGIVVASAISVLVPRDKVRGWLGSESGARGLVIASALGAIMPGGPFASFPLVLALAKAGADIGALIAFLTAWAALSLSRLLIWEIPLLGFDFGMLRLVASLPLPLLAGFLARFAASRILKGQW